MTGGMVYQSALANVFLLLAVGRYARALAVDLQLL